MNVRNGSKADLSSWPSSGLIELPNCEERPGTASDPLRTSDMGRSLPWMGNLDARMVGAWREAAADLGIRLTSPFEAQADDGAQVDLEGFLPDFGHPAGMVFISNGRRVKPLKLGLYASSLSPAYQVYRRSLFVDTLNDWGWFGAADRRPSWFTGEAWR